MKIEKITTLGQLKKSKYQSKSIKQEIRDNLITALESKNQAFEGIEGFEDTVIPDIQRAILSQHNILFLGLRGQAKTKMARMMTQFLDEYIPVITGSEINDDPLHPISKNAIDIINEKADETPISWMNRSDRYVEKLATPDVSIADLIGDVDPIKAATLKLPYSDERVIHFGLIPRAHRSIFVINELPDLQARIQVSLFNILQEGDLQIRGFKLRLPLDIQFVFTANPEDYTNRGSIVTPLKDRIESQILTHYPKTLEVAKKITLQEADLTEQQLKNIKLPDSALNILELISVYARESEYVDEKSGVSARMSISALENLYSAAERRMLMNKEKRTSIRLSDFWGVIPSITGKLELVYEGEQLGSFGVAIALFNQAIKEEFLNHFIHPEKYDTAYKDPYGVIKEWFSDGNTVDIINDHSNKDYEKKLNSVIGLEKVIQTKDFENKYPSFMMELILHGLSGFEVIQKEIVESNVSFKDPLSNMFEGMN